MAVDVTDRSCRRQADSKRRFVSHDENVCYDLELLLRASQNFHSMTLTGRDQCFHNDNNNNDNDNVELYDNAAAVKPA